MKEVLEVVAFDLLAPVCFISSFLFIWFKTDFLVSYLALAGFKLKDYEKISTENPDITLFEFLACKNTKNKLKFFIFKLLSCPFCLAAWVSLCVSLFCSVKLLGAYYVLSLLLFKYLEKTFFND